MRSISSSLGLALLLSLGTAHAAPAAPLTSGAASLALYMQQQPRRAKWLYFDVIPRAVDDYLAAAEKLPKEEPARALPRVMRSRSPPCSINSCSRRFS